MTLLSHEVDVPAENLLQPDLLRRLCWAPPEVLDESSIAAVLRTGHAREWQVELVAPLLVSAFETLLESPSDGPPDSAPADPTPATPEA